MFSSPFFKGEGDREAAASAEATACQVSLTCRGVAKRSRVEGAKLGSISTELAPFVTRD